MSTALNLDELERLTKRQWEVLAVLDAGGEIVHKGAFFLCHPHIEDQVISHKTWFALNNSRLIAGRVENGRYYASRITDAGRKALAERGEGKEGPCPTK